MTEITAPDLFAFVAAWFPDADLEGWDDETVVGKFAAVTPPDRLKAARDQGRAILAQPDIAGSAALRLARDGNLHFETPDEAIAWLRDLMDFMDRHLPGP